jgi:DNA-binding transcriptional LysR family regulator
VELATHELQAFRMVAQALNFSLAAERIHITQPALTQRIQSLERTLGLTLFVRDRKGIKLTQAGLRLLRYCQVKDHLESELLSELVKAPGGKLGGPLRIAGYSSVLHSVIMPSLAQLLRDNPAVQFEFSMNETGYLFGMLERGEADFVVIDHAIQRSNIQALELGQEKYVLVQSTEFPVRDIYLDHDPDDQLTEAFLKHQGQDKLEPTRCYVDNIEGILQAVALGLGQGVVPRHLLRKDDRLKVVKSNKPMSIPVVLHYFRQSYYSTLQKATIEALKRNAPSYLR